MSSALVFIILVVLIAISTTLLVYRGPENAKAFFATKEGKGVLKGIAAFVLVGLVIAGASMLAPNDVDASEPKGTWLAYSEVYLGIDNTRGVSPQCRPGGPNDRLTSNGGFRQNIYRSGDRRLHANAKYTHHSCAFSRDRNGYDAIGVEIAYRFFQR